MVDYVSDANELVRRARALAFGGTLPDDLAEKLQTIPGVAADFICDAAEILYARKDELDDNAKRVMAELFNYAVQQRWTGFNQGDRSETIVDFVSRELGEQGAVKAPSDLSEWPAPKTAYNDGVDWRGVEAEEPVSPEAAPVPAEPTE